VKKLNDKLPESCCGEKIIYKKSKNDTVDYKADRGRCDNCHTSYELNKNTGAVYICKNDGQFIHMNCGEEIDCIWRTHPMWDGLFPCSGSGEVNKYPIPYCPKHEDEPDSHGLPIVDKGI